MLRMSYRRQKSVNREVELKALSTVSSMWLLANRRIFHLRSMVEQSSMVAYESTKLIGNIGALSDDGAGNQT